MPPPDMLYAAITILSCGCALWFGGSGERYGALLLLARSLPGWPMVTLLGSAYQPSVPALLTVDILLFVAFLPMLIRSERYWPIWITAFQFAAITGHFAQAIIDGPGQPPSGGGSYLWARELWQCLMWLGLLPGVLRHHRPISLEPHPPSDWRAGRHGRLRTRWPFSRSIS